MYHFRASVIKSLGVIQQPRIMLRDRPHQDLVSGETSPLRRMVPLARRAYGVLAWGAVFTGLVGISLLLSEIHIGVGILLLLAGVALALFGAIQWSRRAPILRPSLREARCPTCGSVKPVPILYGLPASISKVHAAEKRGELLWGGCLVSGDSPLYACPVCHEGLPELGTRDFAPG